jgi:hypothetical protein
VTLTQTIALKVAETVRDPSSRTMAKKSVKKAATRSTTKRELIDTGTDKRFAKRAADGTWTETDDVGALPAC